MPGVSKNGRLYTEDMIRRSVAQVKERLASPDGMPLTTRTHHAAEDDSTKLVGRLTDMQLAPDGSARFEAVIADTDEGRKIAALAEDHDGKPVLKGVSIRGAWLGTVRQVVTDDGQRATTADDLQIDGLDYTATPGVPGAGIDRIERIAATVGAAETTERHLIFESVQEALVTAAVNEASAPTATGGSDVQYADPGYRADKQKRHPLGSKAHAKAAWGFIGESDNARLYTAAQLKRIKGRIKSALGKFGVTVTQEGWLVEPAARVSEAVAEYFGLDAPEQAGSFSINLDNGVVCVSVSSYRIDPHDLDLIARAAMGGACQALAAMDPDMDGDIDIPGADAEDIDRSDEAAPPALLVEAETPAPPPAATPQIPRPHAGSNPNETEAVVPDATTIPAVETADPTPAPTPGVTLSDDQFAALLARLTPPAAVAALAAVPAPAVESAPAAPAVVETEDQRIARLVESAVTAQLAKNAEPAAPAVMETEDQRITRLVGEAVAAQRTALVQETVERFGPPTRKGLVTETVTVPGTASGAPGAGLPEGWPQKPLHEYTDEERRQFMAPLTAQAVLGHRAGQ